jgi:membrane-bound ClpP family serine protease
MISLPPCPARSAARGPALAAGLLAGLLAAAPAASAQEPKADGLFVTVPNPITEGAVNLIKAKVAYAFGRRGRKNIDTVVFDFNATGPAATSEYGPCITLKNYLLRLPVGGVAADYPKVKTVAFVHGEVSRHTVLAVLACNDLVMSRDSSIGNVVPRGSADVLPDEVKVAYRKLKETKPAWGDLILRLLDENLVVRKVRTRDSYAFWSEATLREERDRGVQAVAVAEQPPGLEPGSSVLPAKLLFRLDRRLATEVLPNRAAVRDLYNLPVGSVREEWLPEQAVPYRVDVNGAIDRGRLDSLQRRLKTAVARGANVIILKLGCEGGETRDVASVARYLKELSGPAGPVVTIAYVPPGQALGAGTFLALGCSQIVMAPGSALGDFEALQDQSDDDLKARRDMLVELAEEQGYPPLLFAATLKRDLDLYQVRGGGGVLRVVTADGRERVGGPPRAARKWEARSRIPHAPGHFLKLDAALCKDCGVAAAADVDDVEELYRRYDLRRVEVSRDDWLDRVAEFFREPLVKVLLIMVGIAGLILELKMPGLGFPGVVAGICFVLFFWAHSFVGQFTMLAVLLFVLGLILIGVEVFITPGVAVMGISGVVLVVGSLVLVTLEHWPETTQDWVGLGTTLASFVGSLLGAVVVAFAIAWYLPNIPYANRLILVPPAEDEAEAEPPGPGAAEAAASLLGAIGEAATPLRPAGKARFGDDYLDVVSEGEYVSPGSRVQVVEVEGNRIVVKEV